MTQDLTKMEVYAKSLEMENTEKGLHDLNERIKEDRFNVAVLGEFNRGKSTLINALLQKKILPSYYRPTTSCVNQITYGIEPRALAEYFDGKTEEISYDDLKEYGTQSGSKSDDVRQITLWYPTGYCSNNVDIYDTPGLNDSPEMAEATANVISRMDAAIFVLTADADFSMSESEFIGEKLLTSDVHRVIFVLNKIGNFSDADRVRLIENTRMRIQELVLQKAEKVLADNPEEMERFTKMLGDIPVYAIDSLMALQARETFDPELLERSGFREFERAVDDLLTRERGRVTLDRQTGVILKTTRDMFDVIQARVIPLTMEESEFAEKAKKAQQEIKTIQELTDKEIISLEEGKEQVLQETQETWKGFMDSMKNTISISVEQIPVSKSDLHGKNKDEFVQRTVSQMVPMVQQEYQIYSERIQNFIIEKIGQNCQRLEDFNKQVSEHIEEIGSQFTLERGRFDFGGNARDVWENLFALTGGVASGYKIAGMKGAALGGAVSALTTVAVSTTALTTIALATGVAVTAIGTPIIVGVTIVGSAIGLLAGKGAVHSAFWKDDAKTLRKQIAEELYKEFNNIIDQYNITENLHVQIVETFEQIKKNVQENTMGTLLDMQKVLAKLNSDYETEKAKSEQLLNEYTEILENLSQITDRTVAVRSSYNLD